MSNLNRFLMLDWQVVAYFILFLCFAQHSHPSLSYMYLWVIEHLYFVRAYQADSEFTYIKHTQIL